MSLLQKLQQATKSEWKPKAHNIAVQVTAYEGDKVRGIRLDTEEEVVASLRPLGTEEAARLSKPRPEIKDFACEVGAITKKLAVCDTKEERGEFMKATKKCEPGGVLNFQQAEVKGGEIVAKWVVAMSRFAETDDKPGHRTVLAGKPVRLNTTYVKSDAAGKKDYYVSATVLDVDGAVKVESREQLPEILAAALQANGLLNGAGVMIRYFERGADGVDQPVVKEFALGRDKVGDEYRFADPLARAKKFLAEDEFGKALAEGFEPGEGVVLEVLPTLRASMSPMAIENMLKNSHEIITGKDEADNFLKAKITGDEYLAQSRNSTAYRVFSDNPQRPKRGFLASSIALEFNGDYDPMYTVLNPIDIGRNAVAAEWMKTANIDPVRPKFVKEAEAKHVEQAAQEAAAGGNDFPVPDPDEFNDSPSAARRSSSPGL